jgi:Ca-activated chloride channel family protein
MLARPQLSGRITKVERQGIEMVIAIDVSNSMMAQDVTPSRLSRSKMMIESLLNKFVNDKIALIVFAGDAFVQLPITNDFVSAKMFLNDISPAMLTNQGTNIAQAIELASSSFTQQEGIGKAIIIITDGEDHEGGAEEAAKAAK